MHLLISKLKVRFWHLQRKSIAIKSEVKIPILLTNILGQSTTSTRPMQVYMDVGVSWLCFNPIQDGGGDKKVPPTSFLAATSANVGFSPKNFLTFSFDSFSTLE